MTRLFLLLVFIVAGEVTVNLTSDNFDDFVKDKNVLVEFYAPWCGHCKALAPKWEAAAVQVNNDDSIDGTIAKVDATAAKDLAGRYGVEGYPTIKWFPKGSLKADDYEGGRETADIVDYVKSATIPDVVTISKKQSADFGKESDYALYSTVKADSKKEKLFDRTCKRVKKQMKKMDKSFECGKTRLKKGKSKVFFRRNKFEENDGPVELKYEGKMAKLEGWALDNIFGQFGLFDTGFLLDRGDKELFLIILKEKKYPFEVDGLGDFVTKMKQETGIQANMVESKLADRWGFPADKDLLYIYAIMKESKEGNDKHEPKDYNRYILDPSESDADFDTFFKQARAGEWELYVKSQLPSDVTQDGLVVPLIGKTFEEVAFDESKDVLVEFYAPWCGHCKKFAPEYEKLAETVAKYYKKKNLLIAKCDATANDVPVEISGFPTIVMFPEGKDAKPVKYEGNRDFDDLIDFIEEYSRSVKPEEKEEL